MDVDVVVVVVVVGVWCWVGLAGGSVSLDLHGRSGVCVVGWGGFSLVWLCRVG